MNINVRNQLFNQVKEWIFEASTMIKNKMNGPLNIQTKSNRNDLVTEIDKETEKYFAKKIKENYPEHFLLSEEGYGDDLSTLDGTVWIIDPIDGTMNFVQQKQNFAISIGIFHNGIGEIGFIYDVMAGILYSVKKGEGVYKNEKKLPLLKQNVRLEEAMIGMNHYWFCQNQLVEEKTMQDFARTVRGTRTYGSAALELAYVAEGILDGYLTMNVSPWDFAAGMIMVNEVGGVTTTISGEPVNKLGKNALLSCHPTIQKQIIEWIEKGKK